MTPEQIIAMLDARIAEQDRAKSEHRRVRRALEGDASVFWETLLGHEVQVTPGSPEMVIANIMQTTGDQLAGRIAAPPTITDRPADPTDPKALRSARLATAAKRDWWDRNDMETRSYAIARNLLAFAEAPVVLRPDVDQEIPCWEERDPNTCYASDFTGWTPTPADAVFVYTRPLADLRAMYERAWDMPGEGHTQVEVIEFYDSQWTVFLARGQSRGYGMGRVVVELDRIPNRIGEPMFVIPRVINFGRRQGSFNQLIGLMAAQSRLQILSLMAAERQVFPKTYISGELAEDQMASGPDATVYLEPGSTVATQAYNSGFQFLTMLDRIERQLRLGGSAPPQFGGESSSTLATGRGNQLLISATVETGVQERQKLLAAGYRHLLERSAKVARAGYWPSSKRQKIIVLDGKGDAKAEEYVPKHDLIEGATKVEHDLLSASDVSQATVLLGQLAGLGLPRSRVLKMHPWVPDWEVATRERVLERLDDAALAALEAQIQSGVMDPRMVTRVRKLFATQDITLQEAIDRALPEAAEEGTLAGPAAPPGFGGAPAPAPSLEDILGQLTGGGNAA